MGRAGRDDGAADAILFHRAEDLTLGNFFATPNPDEEYTALDMRKPKQLKQL